jgi:serine/threonine-protein kinase
MPFTWGPDGTHITFASPEANRIYSISADGSGRPEVLFEGDHPQYPTDWSPNGRVLALYRNTPDSLRDVWLFQRNQPDGQMLLVGTSFQERSARWSPDGQWLAYVSNESGRDEVYIQPSSGSARKVAVSTDGGTAPIWSCDGTELFYLGGESLMVTSVTRTPDLRLSTPRPLFDATGYQRDTGAGRSNASYDVHPDGERFVMLQPSARTEIRVVLNWLEELKRLAPTN